MSQAAMTRKSSTKSFLNDRRRMANRNIKKINVIPVADQATAWRIGQICVFAALLLRGRRELTRNVAWLTRSTAGRTNSSSLSLGSCCKEGIFLKVRPSLGAGQESSNFEQAMHQGSKTRESETAGSRIWGDGTGFKISVWDEPAQSAYPAKYHGGQPRSYPILERRFWSRGCIGYQLYGLAFCAESSELGRRWLGGEYRDVGWMLPSLPLVRP